MNITTEVLGELERAMRKFPTWPTDPLHALAVLGEEFGELTKDVLQLTYEPHKTSRDNVRTEAIQTAAMALRFAASLEVYDYARGVQHAQEAASFGVGGFDARLAAAEREVCEEDGPLLTAAREVVSGSTPSRDCHGPYAVPAVLWLALQAEVMERLRANARAAFGVDLPDGGQSNG